MVRKYYLIVRLFKDWKTQLDLFGSCYEIYRSMRIEINPMDITFPTVDNTEITEEKEDDFIKWNLLHQEYQLDVLVGDPNYPNVTAPNSEESIYPFKIYIIKNLERIETIEWIDKLRVPLYADEVDEDSDEYTEQIATYGDWMREYIDGLRELVNTAKLYQLPNPDFDRFNFDITESQDTDINENIEVTDITVDGDPIITITAIGTDLATYFDYVWSIDFDGTVKTYNTSAPSLTLDSTDSELYTNSSSVSVSVRIDDSYTSESYTLK